MQEPSFLRMYFVGELQQVWNGFKVNPTHFRFDVLIVLLAPDKS